MSKNYFKLLLIEDRQNRQVRFLQNGEKNLDDYIKCGLLSNIAGGHDFDRIKDSFEKSDFSIVQDYDFVAIHRSAFDAETRNTIISNVDNKKAIIFFSGGISESSLIRINGRRFVLINSKTFYDNLAFFLDACKSRNDDCLTRLVYGEYWKLNLLYEALEKFDSIFNKEPHLNKPFNAFETEIPGDYIKKEYFRDCDENTKITFYRLKKVCLKILKEIDNIL